MLLFVYADHTLHPERVRKNKKKLNTAHTQKKNIWWIQITVEKKRSQECLFLKEKRKTISLLMLKTSRHFPGDQVSIDVKKRNYIFFCIMLHITIAIILIDDDGGRERNKKVAYINNMLLLCINKCTQLEQPCSKKKKKVYNKQTDNFFYI